VTLPQARVGAVKILANLSPARSSVVPGVPTSEESGIPGQWWPIIRAAGIKVE